MVKSVVWAKADLNRYVILVLVVRWNGVYT